MYAIRSYYALNQQEGTITSINKRVNPTNAAVAYGGNELNDIANALGLKAAYTIDYTEQLGNVAGFKSVKFDDLPNHYTNAGEEVRGYLLETVEAQHGRGEAVDPVEENALTGDLVYLANPVLQFTAFTNASHQLHATAGLYAAEAFMSKYGVAEGDSVEVKTDP